MGQHKRNCFQTSFLQDNKQMESVEAAQPEQLKPKKGSNHLYNTYMYI